MPRVSKAKAKAPAKRPVGRPSSYRREYCEEVIELGKQGKSLAGIAAAFDVDKASVIRWRDEHPDFRTALAKAMTYSQEWWERLGLEGMQNNKQFNALVWKISMQARFREDYTERRVQEVSGPGGGPIKTENEEKVTLNAEELTPDQREALRVALLKAKTK
mgnify:CR=1 FL=1